MKSRGFTLLEMLIVVSVLAILIAIVVPRIMGFQDQAKISKAKKELQTIQAALESYAIHNSGSYPDQTNGITNILKDVHPQMVDRVLYDPFGDGTAEYQYSVSSDGKSYAVASKGPDGVIGTARVVASGDVPSTGDDPLVTNGTVTLLDVTGDENNCGTIGTMCGAAQSCAASVCTCNDADLTICSESCVETDTDVAHCGACGNECDEGESCTAGVCVAPDPCADSPAVGTVCSDGTVYVSTTLRTTPSDAGTIKWSTEGIVTGASSVTDGAANTAILEGLAGVYPAADACAALSFSGHDDWYLPAKDQLAVFYTNRVAIGELDSTHYWSSTENGIWNAWFHWFITGEQANHVKTLTLGVRCARTP